MCGLVIVVCDSYHLPVLIIGCCGARCMEHKHAIHPRTPRQSPIFPDALATPLCELVFFQLDEWFKDCMRSRHSAPVIIQPQEQ
jgi:hypothetical protein